MSGDKYDWIVGAAPPPLEAHSEAKHAVFRSYVRRYIEVLTSDPRHDALNLTLVDGFAGGGEYLLGGELRPGSPLILLEEVACAQAQFNARRTKPFALKAEFIFVERKEQSFEYLDRTIRNSAYGSEVGKTIHLVKDDFQNVLPTIIDQVRKRGRAHRSIFVLDQYGYSDVSLETIRSILASLENPEIILTFYVDYLVDFLGENEGFLKGILPVELGVADVRDMLGMKPDREARWLIQNFLYRHLMARTGAPYYTCFFVKSPASYKSYWLVHISKHPKARDEMAVRHWAMSNHFIHHGRAGLRMLGFDPEQAIEQIPLDFVFDDDAAARSRTALLTELPPLIFDPGLGNGAPPTLERLFTRVCNETPATTRLISDVLAELRADKEVEILTRDNRPRPRSTKFEWTDVIVPARQRSLFSSVWPPRR